MVVIEKVDGGYRVSRVLPCGASMQAAAMALEKIVPEAFDPRVEVRVLESGAVRVRDRFDGTMQRAPLNGEALAVGDVFVAPNGARGVIVADVSTIDGPATIELRD